MPKKKSRTLTKHQKATLYDVLRNAIATENPLIPLRDTDLQRLVAADGLEMSIGLVAYYRRTFPFPSYRERRMAAVAKIPKTAPIKKRKSDG